MKTISFAVAFLAAFAAPLRAQAPAPGLGECMLQQLATICPDKQGTAGYSACSKIHAQEAMTACRSQRRDAAAAQTKKDVAEKSPCAEDSQKFCPGKWPGTPEYSACMRSHMGDVTPTCAAWGRKRAGTHQPATNDACLADAKKLCPGLTVVDGLKFNDCMTSHYDGLSKTCQTKYKDLAKGKGGAAGDCMTALKPLCPGAQPGSAEMMQCMMDHPKDLPASCAKMAK